MRASFCFASCALLAAIIIASPLSHVRGEDARPLAIIVMDPLAAPLSCPCVKGYAQRNYAALGEYLEEELGRPVQVVFSESLGKALEETGHRADLVIGKRSVVLAQSRKHDVPLVATLALSGKDGSTTQTGLVVVPAADPAQSVADLSGYRIIFGPSDCDEKYRAALELLKQNEVPAPESLETCAACSDGATTILEAGADSRAATVISSYAAPLLEGCGTIKKGDLRVVGTTQPVPFIAVFISTALPESEQAAIATALKGVGEEPVLLSAIESKAGFVPEDAALVAETTPAAKKKTDRGLSGRSICRNRLDRLARSVPGRACRQSASATGERPACSLESRVEFPRPWRRGRYQRVRDRQRSRTERHDGRVPLS